MAQNQQFGNFNKIPNIFTNHLRKQGTDGSPGEFGNNGTAGPPGKDGYAGLQGLPGGDGSPGLQGEQGDSIETELITSMLLGATGPKGRKGPTGPTGASGADGDEGSTGLRGPTGCNGLPGGDGSDGSDGDSLPGPVGDIGFAGNEFQYREVFRILVLRVECSVFGVGKSDLAHFRVLFEDTSGHLRSFEVI